MNVESRIKRIEEKLKTCKEFIVPIIVLARSDENTCGEGVIVIGGDANKKGNNGQKTIETS